MADWDTSEQTIHDLIEEVAKSGISLGGKAGTILQLAEAYAWLRNPAQPHSAASGKSA